VGRPVLLAFLGATCASTCPVVAAELERAQALLSSDHVGIAVVVVNVDPQRLSLPATREALTNGAFAGLADDSFVTGPLQRIEGVWKSYGVTVELDPTTGALAYTNVLYLIDSRGELRE